MKKGSSWRPKEWENPYNFMTGGAIPTYEKQSQAYEDGADELLTSLRREGNSKGGGVEDDPIPRIGSWIFIPEEE